MFNWYKNKLIRDYKSLLYREAGKIIGTGAVRLIEIMVHPNSTDEQVLRAVAAYKSLSKYKTEIITRVERHVKEIVE